MLFAIVFGMIGGAAVAFLASRWLLKTVMNRYTRRPEARNVIAVCGLVFGAISLAPAIFLSVMGGGSLGMRVAEAVAGALGMGDFVTSMILAAEVVVATAVTVAGNVAIGAGLGIVLVRSLRGPTPAGGSNPRAAGPG